MIKLCDFQIGHLTNFKPKTYSPEELYNSLKEALTRNNIRLFVIKKSEDVMCIVGLVEHMPGVAEACVIPGELVDSNKLGFHSIFKALSESVFDVFGLHRLQAMIEPNNSKACKWANLLGFSFEGIARHYTSDGKDFYVYGKVRNG